MAIDNLDRLSAQIIASGKVAPDDVLALRRAVYADDGISEHEAEVLIRIALAIEAEAGDWSIFFAEALADIIVNQVEPEGIVTPEQADWLLAQIGADSAICRPIILTAVTHILELARSAPRSLALAALRGVKLRVGRYGGSIDRTGVDLARRIVFAGSGGEALAVSRPEAEALFEIDGALVAAISDPSWPDFFARAVGNHLLSTAIRMPATAIESNRLQRWVDQSDVDIGGFFRRMTGSGLDREDSVDAALRNADIDAKLKAAAELVGAEIEWVIDRLASDNKLSEGEQRLKSFILEDRASLPPALDAAFKRLAA